MKQLFKPTINKEYGTAKKEKDLCKTESKAMRLQRSQNKTETKENRAPLIDIQVTSSF